MKRTFAIGRFSCVERLDSGPLGETWRAKAYGALGAERHYALRRLHPQWVANAELIGQLTVAAQAYRELEHAGLVHLEEVGLRAPQPYLVYESAEGADLTRLRALLLDLMGPTPGDDEAPPVLELLPDAAVLLGQSLGEVLSYAHDRGVLHLGLCPLTVLVDSQGCTRVWDVGLLRPLQQSKGWQRRPELAVLLAYMAPEVLRGDTPDGRSDVFSVGALLYELIAGRPAFLGDTPEQVQVQVDRGLRSPPGLPGTSGVTGRTLEQLGQVLLRAMASRPSDRYGSMGELLQALYAVPATYRERARFGLMRAGAQATLRRGRVEQQDALKDQEPDPLQERPTHELISTADPLPPPPDSLPPPPEDSRSFTPPPASISSGRLDFPPDPSGVMRPVSGRPLQIATSAPLQLDISRPRLFPGSTFSTEEEESTVPVPHSPRSRIMTIEADSPSGTGPGSLPRRGFVEGSSLGALSLMGTLGTLATAESEETPLPISTPLIGPVTNPGVLPTSSASQDGQAEQDGQEVTRVPTGPYPGLLASDWPDPAAPVPAPGAPVDSNRAAMTERTVPSSGNLLPLARVFPGRRDQRSHKTLAVPEGPPPVVEPTPAPVVEIAMSAESGPVVPGRRSEFDEPTALADYKGSAPLARILGLSAGGGDRSGPLAIPPAVPLPAPPVPSGPTIDTFAPLITAPHERADEDEVLTMEPLEASRPLPVLPAASALSPLPRPPSYPPSLAPPPSLPSLQDESMPAQRLHLDMDMAAPLVEQHSQLSLPVARPELTGQRRTSRVVLFAFIGAIGIGVGATLVSKRALRSGHPSPPEQGGAVALPRPDRPLKTEPPRPPEQPPERPAPDKPAPAPTPAPPVQVAPPPPEVAPAKPAEKQPPAEAAPTDGTLSVRTNVEAALFVDGKVRGATPMALPLTGGPHQIALVAEGYKLWRQEVMVRAGAPLEVTLEKATLPKEVTGDGGLKVRCAHKRQYRIFVDGHDSGANCPSGRLRVSPGAHKVELERFTNGERFEKSLVVKASNRSARWYAKH